MPHIWIGYTTLYRTGGDKLARVAKTMASELQSPDTIIICEAVESKRDPVETPSMR